MLTVTVAQRLTDRLAPDAEDRSDYLDPDLAALWRQEPVRRFTQFERLALQASRGSMRSVGSSEVPQASHWSPRAPSRLHLGQVPSM